MWLTARETSGVESQTTSRIHEYANKEKTDFIKKWRNFDLMKFKCFTVFVSALLNGKSKLNKLHLFNVAVKI